MRQNEGRSARIWLFLWSHFGDVHAKRLKPKSQNIPAVYPAIHPIFGKMKQFLCLTVCLAKALTLFAQQEEFSVPGHNLYANGIARALETHADLGKGITVSIKEFGFDSTDIDLTGRVLSGDNPPPYNTIHAGIMASLAGGAGISDFSGYGAAPACTLLSSSFVGILPDNDYATRHIVVQNHSYGVDIQNWYGERAAAFDRSAVENPKLLHVFSVGNKGDSASLSGTYAHIPGFANLSGEFKMAKNVLLVGSVDSFLQVDPRSSRGPAFDGRIKPDLVAFGFDGSSGAAALCSGVAADLAGWMEAAGADYGSDLLRAYLINSADDIGAPGPDFMSGFGNLNFSNLVFDPAWQFRGSIQPGETVDIPLQIPAQVRDLKATLAWTDPPAAAGCRKALLNDLDLELLSPSGESYLPWALNPAPNADSLSQAARRGRDTLNTVEQISLDTLPGGAYMLRVKAPAGMSGPQVFSVVWRWETGVFHWIYPYKNCRAEAGKAALLHWDAHLPDNFGRLEYQLLPGNGWRTLKDSLSLTSGMTHWLLPDSLAGCLLRMRVGGQELLSDTFSISRPITLKIGFDCPDSLMLYWKREAMATGYRLMGLIGGRMQELAIGPVTDTFVILSRAEYPYSHFAVRAISAQARGMRGPAPNVHTQGVGCYVSNFIAELNTERQVDLRLSLGTTYGLSQVVFEKEIKGKFEPLGTFPAAQNEVYTLDLEPFNGINRYRVHLFRQNGLEVFSDTAMVYFPGSRGFWVFPNPAATLLNISSDTDGEALFELYDGRGALVLEQKLEETNQQILVGELPRGVYFYRVRGFGGGVVTLW